MKSTAGSLNPYGLLKPYALRADQALNLQKAALSAARDPVGRKTMQEINAHSGSNAAKPHNG